MKKLIAGLVAGISAVTLALIAVLLVPAQTFWKIVFALLGFCAVVSVALQRVWAKQDNDAERKDRKTTKKAEEKERHRLYALLHKVLAEVRGHETRRQSEDSMSVVKASEKAGSIIDWLANTDPTDQQVSSEWERTDLSPERDRAFHELEEELLQALRARI